MELKEENFAVIGAGLSRTGTLSTRTALAMLFNGPGSCYHMQDVVGGSREDQRFWLNLINGKILRQSRFAELRNFFGNKSFVAGVDYPICLFYKDLMKAFPAAKVVLTVREPRKWYQSVKATTYQSKLNLQSYAFRSLLWVTGYLSGVETAHELATFVPDGLDVDLITAIEQGEEATVKFFDDWTEAVKKHVPEDKLLVYNVEEGWKPLCEFLGRPVPKNATFPKVNSKSDIQAFILQGKITGAILLYFVFPLCAAFLIYLFIKYAQLLLK